MPTAVPPTFPEGRGRAAFPPFPSPSPEFRPPWWLLPRPRPGVPPPPPPPPSAGLLPPHLLSWDNVVPWPPPWLLPPAAGVSARGDELLWGAGGCQPRPRWKHQENVQQVSPGVEQHRQWRGGGRLGGQAERSEERQAASSRFDYEAEAATEDTFGGGGGFVLWHRDRVGLLRSEDEDEEDERGRVEDGQQFMLTEEWIERFARTEAIRQQRDKERRREARRQDRPKVPAALAAEEKVAAVLAARRAAEQQTQQDDQQQDEHTAVDEAVALYGVEGANVVARLEARLNAEYDALVDRKAPPHWPCEALR